MIGISGLKGPGLCKRICRSTFKIPKAGARVGEPLKKDIETTSQLFPRIDYPEGCAGRGSRTPSASCPRVAGLGPPNF